MALTLQEITKRKSELGALHKQRETDFANQKADFKREMAYLAEQEAMIVGGLDTDKVEAGKSVIYVTGKLSAVQHGYYPDQQRHGTRTGVVDDARDDIAAGAPKLRDIYFGVKNYDHFGDQRTDCEYGMGPRHGSIVFAVGLQSDVRKRLRDGGELSPAEIDAALYVLTALPQIENARAAVAA